MASENNDLWGKIGDVVSGLGSQYIDKKYGGNTSNQTSSETQLQGTVNNPQAWKTPAVIIGIVGVGVAVLAIVLRK
ncbi:MAG: hypothetical protein LBQ18_05950 [Campylobacteraceae bacterium]|jgi:hypothetical protein|nr:hypothetical protein [Campylobacteraceae bacterium]